MFDEAETKNDTMMSLSASMPESKGDLMLPHETTMPAAGAVFAEPIVTAQPCRITRNHAVVLQKIKVLAQMAGEDYCYRYPVKDKNGGKKFIEGPTIVLANDLAREYMNCMVDVRTVEQATATIFYARFVDYETGFCMTRAFRQRKGQKTINTDAERQEDIVFQIGQSKAIRNVIVNALQSYADFMFREAKNSLVVQIGAKLEEWRGKMQRGIAEKKYDLKRIEATVGMTIDKWLAPDIARVLAELKSIADGMATFDDLYPDPKQANANNPAALNEEYLGKEQPGKPSSEVASPPAVDPAVAAAQAAVANPAPAPVKKEAKKPANPTSATASSAELPASQKDETSTVQPAEKSTSPSNKGFLDSVDFKNKAACEGALMRLYDILEKTPLADRPARFAELGALELVDALDQHQASDGARKYLAELGVGLPSPIDLPAFLRKKT